MNGDSRWSRLSVDVNRWSVERVVFGTSVHRDAITGVGMDRDTGSRSPVVVVFTCGVVRTAARTKQIRMAGVAHRGPCFRARPFLRRVVRENLKGAGVIHFSALGGRG